MKTMSTAQDTDTFDDSPSLVVARVANVIFYFYSHKSRHELCECNIYDGAILATLYSIIIVIFVMDCDGVAWMGFYRLYSE